MTASQNSLSLNSLQPYQGTHPRVEATDVERQFGTQDLEEAQDVFGGLAEGVRNVVGSAVAQIRQDLRTLPVAVNGE
jgi:hypothetical protein